MERVERRVGIGPVTGTPPAGGSAARSYGSAAVTLIILLIAEGLMLIALATLAGRTDQPWAQLVFWAGLAVMFAPVMAGLAWGGLTRAQYIGLITVIGMGLYFVKILHSPLMFTQHDEFYHARTYYDIMQTGHLFNENPLLLISAFYPSMEIIASAMSHVTGLSLFPTGVLLIAVARLILILSLFFFFERVSSSIRIAGLATAIYMANPNFLYFDSMFKYEVVALAFSGMVLFALTRYRDDANTNRIGWLIIAAAGMAGAVTSHHLTAYALTFFLFAWAVVAWRRHDPSVRWVLPIALLGLGLSVVWALWVAPITLKYLSDPIVFTWHDIRRLLSGDPSGSRQLFQSSSGSSAPLWERVVAFGSVGLLMLALPFGLRQIWWRYRSRAVAILLGVGTLLYPASLVLRFVKRGWEVSNRTSEFVYVPLGFVVAVAAVYFLVGRPSRAKLLAVTFTASIILIGGIVAGWPPDWRLPGPYLPESDTRSVDLEGTSAAEWALAYLGPNQAMAADRTNNLLMGALAHQNETAYVGATNVDWILFAPDFGKSQVDLLRQGRLHYLVVDRRVLNSPELARSYFPDSAIGLAIAKFQVTPGVVCPFSSGNIMICDVGVFGNAR